MFGRKGGKGRDRPAPSGGARGGGGGRSGQDMANMLGFGGMEPDDDDDDEDLLAELAALEGKPQPKKKPPPKKGAAAIQQGMATVEQMAAEALRDIDDDEDADDDDFDENDLLGELDELMEEDDDDGGVEPTQEQPPPQIQPPQRQPPPQIQQPQVRRENMTDEELQRQEEEDLRLALAMSLNDRGGRVSPQPPSKAPQAPQPQQLQQPLHPVQTTPAPSGGGSDTLSLLRERKGMYGQAIEQAKTEGNSSKARRFQRGLKELEGLIKRAEKGGAINEDDIPPPVAVKGAPAPPPVAAPIDPAPITTPAVVAPPPQAPIPAPRPHVDQPVAPLIPDLPAPPPPRAQVPVAVDSSKVELLLARQKEFKIAALKMKQADNVDMARKCLQVSKHLQTMIEDVQAGKDVDMSSVPKSPNFSAAPSPSAPSSAATPVATTTAPPPPTAQPQQVEVPAASSEPAEQPPGAAASSGPPPPPQTVMEAFQQRLLKYQGAEKEAKAEGNGSKARRMGRIVKQYQDAIKAYKANRPVDYNELPCPPGYGPFPGVTAPTEDQEGLPAPALPTPSAPQQNNQVQPAAATPAPAVAAAKVSAASVIKPSRNQKEHEFLLNRQKEFKMHALKAKQAGDIEAARDHLRNAKSLDSMIAAAENGLRVDLTTVPALPSGKPKEGQGSGSNDSEVSVVKNSMEFEGNMAQQYLQIENALKTQIETSEKNLEHYKLLGNLDAAKNFQGLLQSSQKDLATLLSYKKQRSPVPKCHTVLKTFPVIRSNPHLSDAELEVVVVRCTNVPLPSGWQPKDMYTYVTYEFPYPPEEKVQTGNTTTKKETVNPEFNESFKVIIDRKNRAFSRYCKRNGITLKVHHQRGFLKGDKALGQVTVKFEHFNNRCEIHEALDLMDLEKGRKAVGGKMEVKVKIREPLVDKDAEIIKENWLVLDTHLRGLDMSTAAHAESAASTTSVGLESMEVMRYEMGICEKKMAAYKSQGKNPPAQLVDSMKSYQQKIHFAQTKLKEGGRNAVGEYLVALTSSIERQRLLAQEALKKNDKETAKECLTKKKLIDKEVALIKQRLGV